MWGPQLQLYFYIKNREEEYNKISKQVTQLQKRSETLFLFLAALWTDVHIVSFFNLYFYINRFILNRNKSLKKLAGSSSRLKCDAIKCRILIVYGDPWSRNSNG